MYALLTSADSDMADVNDNSWTVIHTQQPSSIESQPAVQDIP